MGIFRDVKLSVTGPVAVRHPLAVATLQLPGLERADLTVSAEVTNAAAEAVSGVLTCRIEDIEIWQEVTLGAGEIRKVVFAPRDYPPLALANPRVWWPATMGAQNLYAAELEFAVGGSVSDRQTWNFGIRDVQAPLTEEGYRYFIVNGRKALMRGGAWTSDLLLRHSHERVEDEVRYAADIGLNMLRMEGKLEFDDFYDLCDQYGIMLMPGWCCCDIWQFPEFWNDEDYTVAAESLRTQLRQMRNHPSVVVWLNGSDDPPSPDVERMYINILASEDWPVPYLSSAGGHAGGHVSQVTGASGVKMTGPYEYEPPEYWSADTQHGGAWGFNTETNPGEAIPPAEILSKFVPPEHLWPIDLDWIYHDGRGYYMLLHPFNRAMDRRYGGAESVDEYTMKAQVLDYDNHRGMFEAYGQQKYHATGVIQFLMNSAWPSLIWHLYDYYLYPGGAYFGAKKALEPVHAQYSYQDRAIVAVNSTYNSYPNASLSATVLNFDLTEKYSNRQNINIEPDGVVRAFAVPEIADLTTTYFVRLELDDEAGAVLSRNFYWLSTQPVVFLWDLTTGAGFTPVAQDADLTMLNTLPPAALDASLTAVADEESGWKQWQVHVENPGSTLAFFVQLRLRQGPAGDDVVPVYWEENYFSLFPGESRDVSVRCRASDLAGPAAAVEVSAWNVAPATVE
jgi:exo-1,4-beta-D-glucosaminidase